MAAGYNAAMEACGAEYMAYLHQDAFVLNHNLISDCIDIFRSAPDIGMIGVLGEKSMPENAVFWDSWNLGAVYACNGDRAIRVNGTAGMKNSVIDVAAVDGMCIITDQNIKWREDLFDGFDFYDVSQCMEYTKRGYRIVIPRQNQEWILHDCGHSKFLTYDKYRKKFCIEYGRFAYTQPEISEEEYLLLNREAECISHKIKDLLQRGEYEAAIQIAELPDIVAYRQNSNELNIICHIMEIYCDEQTEYGDILFGKKDDEPETLIRKYVSAKFLLHRIEQNFEAEEAGRMLRGLSEKAVMNILAANIWNQNYVMTWIGNH